MGRINVLGFDVANLIAAGEVVDRPSSVVKELLENSIDSGANSITVEIQRGGVAFIRISDNGCGIEPDDLPVAILRHATSKISSAEDLSHIGTLGFRGEALAAISSVSRMRIFSRTDGALMGAMLTADGGDVIDVTETGCAKGTTVVVEELFYNVPARRKFLKKDSTEAAAVSALVEKIALSRPDISLKYICDGEVKFYTHGDGKLKSAMQTVFGREAASRMIEVNRSSDNGISVKGYTSEPDLIKSTRNMENFFINGRFVKSRTIMAAVEQAYRTRIPSDKFPFCVLNIEMNPAVVDVNVHPAKLEVKFSNERIIFDSVYYAVLNALESEVVRPELKLFPGRHETYGSGAGKRRNLPPTGSTSGGPVPAQAQEKTERKSGDGTQENVKRSEFWIDGSEARRLLGAFVPADVKRKLPEQERIPFKETETVRRAEIVERSGGAASEAEAAAKGASVPHADPAAAENRHAERAYGITSGEKENRAAGAQSENLPEGTNSSPPVGMTSSQPGVRTSEKLPSSPQSEEAGDYMILGEAYNTYVILQLEDRLLFVDKHAAHERIIFDELCRRMKSEGHSGQMLLAPLTVTVPELYAEALDEYEDKIKSLGFDFKTVKNGSRVTISVDQIPDMLNGNESVELLETLLSQLSEVGMGVAAAADEFFEARLFQSSCKAAVKGGRIYDEPHIRWICDRLIKKPDGDGSVIRTCPHGRPVAFEVKKSSIDRQFARLD